MTNNDCDKEPTLDPDAVEGGRAEPALGPEPPQPYGAWRAFFAVVSYFLGAVVSGLGIGVLLGVYWAATGVNVGDATVVSQKVAELRAMNTLLTSILGAVIFALYAKLFLPDLFSNPEDSGLRRVSHKWILAAAAMGVLLSTVAQYIMTLMPPKADFETGPLVKMATSSTEGLIVWSLLAVLLAPMVEEVLFRGVLFTGLRRRWGTKISSISVTVVFVLLHWGEAGGYLPALLSVTALGTLVLALRLKSHSIWPSITCHFFYNGLIALLMLWPTLFPTPGAEGLRFVQEEKFSEAILSFDEAIDNEPTNAEFYFLRAFSKDSLGQNESALVDYDKSLSLKPKREATILNARAYLLAELGRYEEALLDSQSSLELEPESAASLDTLGYIQVGLKDYAAAMESYEKAIELDPSVAEAVFGRGVCLRELGDHEAAERDFESARNLDPDVQLEWKPAVNAPKN